jgi:hypothetical protein
MLTEFTYNEYRHMHWNWPYIILVEVIQRLTCFDDCSSVSVRQELQHLRHLHQPMKMSQL